MKTLRIKPAESSPEVILDHEKSIFIFRGDSRPDDAREFYTGILKWLDEYHPYLFWLQDKFPDRKPEKISVDFMFNYFNSTSARFIMDIIMKFIEIQKECSSVKLEIIWYYQKGDDDILDAGKEFEKLANTPFIFRTE